MGASTPVIPLILKVSSDNRLKRLRFSSHDNLPYVEFRARIARAFQFADHAEPSGVTIARSGK